jgi:hypothetical protein
MRSPERADRRGAPPSRRRARRPGAHCLGSWCRRRGTWPVLDRDLGHRGWHSGGWPTCRSWHKTFPPGRIRPGPPMYEMGGPGSASPRQADQLPGLGRRRAPPPVPGTRWRDRSPGSSHVPGVAPRWCPFPTVKAFLLPPRTPHKSLKRIYSGFSRCPQDIHRKSTVIRARR